MVNNILPKRPENNRTNNDRKFVVNKNCETTEKISWIFQQRVKEERRKNCITQEQLAESIGVSIDTIKRIENGKGAKLDVAYNIAAALRVPLESLLPQQKYLSNDSLTQGIHNIKQISESLLEKLNKE